MILALISIACFSDISNSLQAMLICARISNAIGTDAFLHDVHLGHLLYCCHSLSLSFLFIAGFESMLWNITEQKKFKKKAPWERWILANAFSQGAYLLLRSFVISRMKKKILFGLYVICAEIKWPLLWSIGQQVDECKCQRLCQYLNLLIGKGGSLVWKSANNPDSSSCFVVPMFFPLTLYVRGALPAVT